MTAATTTVETTSGTTGTRAGDVVLRAEHVSVVYDGELPTRAVRDVSLELRRGEVLGIAGESGCGKSTLAYALTRLLRPPARLTEGTVHFYGRDGSAPVDIMTLDPVALRRFRWSKMSMVFQSAMNALNPVTSLRRQFSDIFDAHRPEMGTDEKDARSRELLDMVGIDPRRLHNFPHELSGGMRQRVVIAMALALKPEVVIMDEPTTALDVVVQREILGEIELLQEELGFSIIFITHDLSLLLEISDRLAVMYAGAIVEYAPAEPVAQAPAHPYTFGLLQSFPDIRGERRELHGVPGSPPDLREPVIGCSFAPRCQFAFDPCPNVTPVLGPPRDVTGADSGARRDLTGRWSVACHLHDPNLRPDGPPPEMTTGPADQVTTSRPPARTSCAQVPASGEER